MSDLTTTLLFTVGYVLLILAVPLLVIFLLERFYRAPIDPQDEELPITDLGPQSAAPSSVYRVEAQSRDAAKQLQDLDQANLELDNVYEEDHPVDFRYSPRIRPSDAPSTPPASTEPQDPPPAS